MKNKNTGPDTKKWKEFRYNLIKEDTEPYAEGYDSSRDFSHHTDNDMISFGQFCRTESGDVKELLEQWINKMSENIEIDADNEDDIRGTFDEPTGDEENNFVKEGKTSKYFNVAKWRDNHKK